MSKRIYLDYATTTPLDKSVERVMSRFARDAFGNPESLHKEGVVALHALEAFRTSIARSIEAHPHEIIFTSGGTESNNLALFGVISGLEKKGMPHSEMHIVLSAIEHSSVRECAQELARQGVQVTTVPVTTQGLVTVSALEKALTEKTVLVSIMQVNNEIGTIQPIEKISALLKCLNQKRAVPIYLHTDACQSPLYVRVNQNILGADLISFDGHKLYGPKGVGALYIRNGTPCSSVLFGGGQEKGKRPGTVPLALVAGFSQAFMQAVAQREKESKRLAVLRDYFLSEVHRVLPEVVLNGSATERVPSNINISIPGLDAEFAVLQLDVEGIACSAKSACLEHERESYVVKALGRNDGAERSSLRFTFGRTTNRKELRAVVRTFKKVVGVQRRCTSS